MSRTTKEDPAPRGTRPLRLLPQDSGRPDGQLLPEDLGIVANVDRQRRVEQEMVDVPCQRMPGGQVPGVRRISSCLRRRRSGALLGPGLDHDDRHLLPALADADECRSIHGRMSIDDRLARNGEHRPMARLQAVRLATAEPESIVSIEVPHVAHAMPESRPRPGSCGGRWLRVRVTYCDVTTAPRTISSPISPGGRTSSAPMSRIALIANSNHLPLDAGKSASARTCRRRPPICGAVSSSTSRPEIEATGKASVAP